jgi:hypothetical protein
MSEAVESGSLETKDQLGTSPKAVARKWKLELKLADKREENWRRKAREIYTAYTPETAATNSFNILWSNTETLRQAVYNSLPQPEVRRRYQEDDPLGRAVSDVLGRALEFAQDTYDFDQVLKSDVLCMLLAGRAVSRVRYVPDFKTVGEEAPEASEEATSDTPEVQEEKPEADDAQESESYEEIDWEQAICENVNYDDFRILCAAKTWAEVTAIAFRHRFTREDCVEKFGEDIGNKIPLDAADDEDVKKAKEVEDLFKTAEVWEIWDKDGKKVHFICPTYPEPCKTQDDPLKLKGFFPIPRPIYAIENDTTLVPAPLYSQYEQQAKELNRVSGRINKLVEALKVRGIYDSTLTELASLMEQGDNRLIGAENVTALIERGGLEKAIWMLPIDTLAMVIKELYIQRDQAKQVIYEITGISDIMRSASDPNETFGAQKIKTKWGTQRLQRMQMEVQRYIRDLIRLKAEIIAEKFQMGTLEQMTLIDLPHQAEVDQKNQQMMMQYQQAMMKHQQIMRQGPPPQQPGQPPAPQPPQQPQLLDPVTWEKVMEAMQNDATRTYRIDIETDSTIAATQDADFDGLNKVMTAVSAIFEKLMPLVQMGDMEIEVLKQMMLVPCRRAKMGSAVEDAINKIKQPPPRPDPEQTKMQAQQQIEAGKAQQAQAAQQAQMQHEAQLEQMKAQLADQQHQRELQANMQSKQIDSEQAMQIEQHKQEMQAQQIQHQNSLEAERELQRQQLEAAAKDKDTQQAAALEAQRMEFEASQSAQAEAYKDAQHQREIEAKMQIAQLEYRKAIEVAEISAASTLQASQASAAVSASKGEEVKDTKPTLPDVHIHMPSGKKTIKKNSDGSYTASDE